MSLTSYTVLSFRVLSFPSRSLIMSSAGSTGTEVNKAVTSYDLRHSPGINITLLTCSTKSWVLWMWWRDLSTSDLSILVSTLATQYVTDPWLDTIGMRGVSSLWILGAHRIWGHYSP